MKMQVSFRNLSSDLGRDVQVQCYTEESSTVLFFFFLSLKQLPSCARLFWRSLQEGGWWFAR